MGFKIHWELKRKNKNHNNNKSSTLSLYEFIFCPHIGLDMFKELFLNLISSRQKFLKTLDLGQPRPFFLENVQT